MRRPGKATRAKDGTITTCPECGSSNIEWTMTSFSLRHSYSCKVCGYQGEMVLETGT